MKQLYFLVTCLALIGTATTSLAQDYTSYNKLAKEEYDKKNYLNVIDYANRSLNASRNGAAYWYRGMARYYLNNYTDATDDFSNAISYYSSDNTSLGNLYYWRALCNYNMKKYKESLPDFELTKSYGYEDKLNMYWSMAFAEYNIAEYDKAADFYTQAMNYTSDNSYLARLYRGRGDCKDKQFKEEEAIKDYSKAIEYDPNYSDAYWARGASRAMNFQNDLAAADYTSAINILLKANKTEKEADLAILYSNRGRMYWLGSKYDEARADFEKSLSLNPNNGKANWNMGDVLYSLKDYKGASKYYLQALSLLTSDIGKKYVYKSLSDCSQNMLDYTQSLSYINEDIKLDSGYGGYYSARAHIYYAKKNYKTSLVDYNRAAAYYEDDKYDLYKNTRMLLYVQRAWVKTKLKDNAGALEDFKKATKEDSTSAYAWYHLGRFYKLVLKQNGPAPASLQTAINLSSAKDTTSDYIYARVIKGDKQEAFTVAERLIKKDEDNKDRFIWDIYNAACIYALAGDLSKALHYLDKAFAAGFDNFDHLYNDEDWDLFRSLPAFKAVLAKYKVPLPK